MAVLLSPSPFSTILQAANSNHWPLFLILFLHLSGLFPDVADAAGGQWTLLQPSIGISAMHMQLLHNDRVVIFDRTDFGPSNVSLPSGRCRQDQNDRALTTDCTAHSVEYDVTSNTFRPLMVLTDTWCSSGSVAADGSLIQTGGYNDGDRVVRVFRPCDDNNGCDWEELPDALTVRRWYATNHVLPDGRSIIIGGRRQFNYEFYPKSGPSDGVYWLPFLQKTRDSINENNLYPFLHLNVDGNLFLFANNMSVLLDYKRNAVVKYFPAMPGGQPRNYPSSGSSVLLPLSLDSQGAVLQAEVLVCGGSPIGAYEKAKGYVFVDALASCGRMTITAASPEWVMETMPVGRVMGDMLLIPTGDVLIVNGAKQGTAGWELGRAPATSPVLYLPVKPAGARFVVQSATTTPRLYHSSAVLLRDGRILVGGSNPHVLYKFYGEEFPTDLSLQAFSPDYLSSSYDRLRPAILQQSAAAMSYGGRVKVQFKIPSAPISTRGVSVTMLAPPFSTHSFSMSQRLIFLGSGMPAALPDWTYDIEVPTPASAVVAPPGYYMLFVVHAGVPSKGVWVHIA